MASGVELKKESLVSAIEDLNGTLKTLLSGARDAVKESMDQFIKGKIAKMFGLVSAYKRVLEKLQLQTKEELEKTIQQFYKYPNVREVCDSWHDLEHEWDAFLKDVDAHFEKSGPQPVMKGELVRMDQSLVNARTGETTNLKDQFGPTDPTYESSVDQASTSESAQCTSAVTDGWNQLVLILLRHFA